MRLAAVLAAVLAAGCGVAVAPATAPPACGGETASDQLGAIHFLTRSVGLGLTLPTPHCGPMLAVSHDGGYRWVSEGNPLPTGGAGLLERLTATSTSRAWAVVGTGRLMATTNGGTTWTAETHRGQRFTTRPNPAWMGRPCSPAGVAAAGHRVWLICLGGAAAGSSTKALFHTADGGHRWTIVSQVTSLTAPLQPGAITRGEPDAFVAASPTRLWLAALNNLFVSNDGGARWSNVPGPDPQGTPASFDVLSPTHAWLLGAGEGLWRTTDGRHWSALGRPEEP